MNLSVLQIISCLIFSNVFAENVCGDWEPYKEEKCIKLFDSANTHSFADAEKICSTNDSKLITIHFYDDQTFLENYLFTKKSVVDNVWLGAKSGNVHNVFQWKDGSNFTFTNWAAGNPKNNPSDNCVQMHAEDELKGKWSNEPCSKKNLVVCEKEQTWSLKKMQELLIKTMQSVVPIGFIYVQLPQEKSPQEIWPWMSWTDVSFTYDSTFFRVAGSRAEAFGKTQPESIPFIDTAEYSDCQMVPSDDYAKLKTEDKYQFAQKIPQSGGWSGRVVSTNLYNFGKTPQYMYKAALRFHVTPGEVRPKNMAVKVWKRTG